VIQQTVCRASCQISPHGVGGWDQGVKNPVAGASSGLSGAGIRQVDRFENHRGTSRSDGKQRRAAMRIGIQTRGTKGGIRPVAALAAGMNRAAFISAVTW
jgi:hypothetical protein